MDYIRSGVETEAQEMVEDRLGKGDGYKKKSMKRIEKD